METMPLEKMSVLDAGSGLSNRLLDWYRPRVGHAYLLDFLVDSREEGNTSIVRADLEQGIPMPDASVDLVTSASSVEHLSARGQCLFFTEAQRVLRPGGVVAMTVSYTFGLTERALGVLSSNPILANAGVKISARLNLRKMLEAAPVLRCPQPPDWSRLPGFDGFSEENILNEAGVIFDRIHANVDDPMMGMSVVRVQLYQLMTGYIGTAARNRVVRSIIQHVSTPPPLPPVTNRLSAST